jgi:shikimate dehydrogenase
METEKNIFGLVGKNISYSYSKKHFNEKFKNLNLKNCQYENFDKPNLKDFEKIICVNNIKGLNITIPFKREIIPFLDSINIHAKKIGAVNTIKINSKKKLIGYNTDYIGFMKSIKPFLKKNHKKAIILGTGGASKAIIYALHMLNISTIQVSRIKSKGNITYKELDSKKMKECQIIINCSPVGTFPKINECPKIPYEHISESYICFDLIYNPKETKFIKESKKRNGVTINGEKMLEIQAEESWKIWNT